MKFIFTGTNCKRKKIISEYVTNYDIIRKVVFLYL